MANHGSPESNMLEGVIVPEGFEDELSAGAYEEVVERLWSLDIVPTRPPALPVVYSRPLDSERNMMFFAIGERIKLNNEYRVAQRLIFNVVQEEAQTERPFVLVDDFMLEHECEGILHKKSLIMSRATKQGVSYSFSDQMPPFIHHEDLSVTVTFGSKYENHYFDVDKLCRNNLTAEEELLGRLSLLSTAYRDPITDFKAYQR